jgi:hypothetical protein
VKRQLSLLVFIILLVGIGVVLGIKLGATELEGFSVLSSLFSLNFVLGAVVIVSGMLLIYLTIKFDLKDKLLALYRLDLNGKLILRFNSSGDSEQGVDYEKFKDKLVAFQSEYDFLEYKIDYGSSSINIEFKTSGRTTVESAEEVLEQLTVDLEDMLSYIASEQIFIDLNATGETSSLLEKVKFVISNRKQKVGINKNRYPRGLLGRLVNSD